jgi:hypothetical protein
MTFLRISSTALLAALACATASSIAGAADAEPAVPTVAPVAPASDGPLPATQPPAASPAEPAPAKGNVEPAAEAPVSAFGRPKRYTLPVAANPEGASRQAPQEQVRADDGLMGSYQKHFYGMVGYRATRVTSDGYQPFASDPVFHQLSIVLGRVLFTDDALSVALGAGWEYGASDANARGAPTELNVHRLSLLPELRYHFARRLYAFGRVGAGISFMHAELADAVTATRRVSDRVAFSVDPNVGLAFQLIGEPAGVSAQPRVWVLLDGGYLFTTATKTVLANESGSPSRSQDHAFADLGLSGLSGRLSVALTF